MAINKGNMIFYPTRIQVFSGRDGGLVLEFSDGLRTSDGGPANDRSTEHKFFVSDRSAKGLIEGILSHFDIELNTEQVRKLQEVLKHGQTQRRN